MAKGRRSGLNKPEPWGGIQFSPQVKDVNFDKLLYTLED